MRCALFSFFFFMSLYETNGTSSPRRENYMPDATGTFIEEFGTPEGS
jgi:hypothetical protein